MGSHRGVVYLPHLGVVAEILHHLEGILHMSLHTEGERLQSLQQDPGIERRQGSTGITEDDRPNAGNEGSSSGHIGKDGAMITGIWLSQGRILVGVGFPVERSSIHDHTT